MISLNSGFLIILIIDKITDEFVLLIMNNSFQVRQKKYAAANHCKKNIAFNQLMELKFMANN